MEDMTTDKISEGDSDKMVTNKPGYAHFLLPGAILIAAILVSGTIIYNKGGTANVGDTIPEPAAYVDIKVTDKDHILGNKDAKVTIVEFSDFQCPFCRSFFSAAYQDIKKQYIDTGKVRLIFRHFPLDFHPAARPSAMASECAGEQGKFWEMHDKIFFEQAKSGTGTVQFSATELKTWAVALRLNAGQFNQCLDSNKYASVVDEGLAYAGTVGISGTPTFFVNGNRIVGAQPFANFKALIDKEL